MCKSFPVFCFDFDGTIGDTEPDIRGAWLSAIEHLNWDKGKFDSIFRVGPPLQDTAKMLYPEKTPAELEVLQATYKHFYDDMDNQIALPYAGIIEVLKELAALNKRVYVVTNKRGKILKKMMVRFGLLEICHGMFFPDIVDPENHLTKTAILAAAVKCAGYSPEETLMVGDTHLDVAAARNNNCPSVAVTWGYSSKAELIAAEPTYIIDHPAELLKFT